MRITHTSQRRGRECMLPTKGVSSYLGVAETPVFLSVQFPIFMTSSAVLVRCDACKGAFRPLSLCLSPLSRSSLEDAPSNEPRNWDDRLRGRNEQYDISPLPSFPSGFLCSSLIFASLLVFFPPLYFSIPSLSLSFSRSLARSLSLFSSLCSEY